MIDQVEMNHSLFGFLFFAYSSLILRLFIPCSTSYWPGDGNWVEPFGGSRVEMFVAGVSRSLPSIGILLHERRF